MTSFAQRPSPHESPTSSKLSRRDAGEARREGHTLKGLVRSLARPLVRGARQIGTTIGGSSRQTSELVETLQRLDKRVRNIELEVQAILRKLYLDESQLPYPYSLTVHRFRLSSQNEEDGITLAILRRIGVTGRRFVELGSGASGGNSAFLARECGWTGLMVDGSEEKIAALRHKFSACNVIARAAWITRENVNQLVEESGFAGEVDLLSIDIDGNDYWVWEALTVCSPRLVIIEYNSLFGPTRAVTVPYDPKFDRHAYGAIPYHGASLAALAHLAGRKGYRLVATEPRGINAYFIRNDLAPDVPACAPSTAFHLLYSRASVHGDAGIYQLLERAGLPLVEVDMSDANHPVSRQV